MGIMAVGADATTTTAAEDTITIMEATAAITIITK